MATGGHYPCSVGERNFDIVLTAEGFKFVITEECPKKSDIDATDDQSQEMFGEQNRSAKQTVMKAILNTKMVEGSLVRDHVLKMMGLLNELEVLGAVIDKEFQVEMVQQTPLDIF
uniref:Uncharacterized protein LOC104234570 n=1 Tax=Nicotiana sylvestris TaxID=4096 RepID=A0A1U7XJ14_NICSY|nr:PREDICTED: uncharacterized protein LOC104234570 [Nicotiana sylvestris]